MYKRQSAYRNTDGGYVAVIINYSDEDIMTDIRGLGYGIWNLYRTSDEPGERLRLTGTTQNLESIMIPRRSVTTLTSGGVKAE